MRAGVVVKGAGWGEEAASVVVGMVEGRGRAVLPDQCLRLAYPVLPRPSGSKRPGKEQGAAAPASPGARAFRKSKLGEHSHILNDDLGHPDEPQI